MSANIVPVENIYNNEQVYLNALQEVLHTGERRETRNSVTLSKFGLKLDFDIKESFPLITTKKVYWKGVVHELLWFIGAKTNSKLLEKEKVNIWKDNSTREILDSIGLDDYEEGDCGPIYGFQWRHFNAYYRGCHVNYRNEGVDQLQNCIDLIKNHPQSRRIFMSGWNPCQLFEMCLPPCHVSYHFYVSENKELSCMMYQRSADMFLGLPFNIASTSLLVYMIANITETTPGKVSIVIGDAHIYEEHIDQVRIQLQRSQYAPPKLVIRKIPENIDSYSADDFELIDYQSHPIIKAVMIA